MTSTTEATAPDQPRPQVSRTALIVSVIVALALGGLAGVVVGWKVEQQRVKDDVQNVRPVGRITAVNGDSVTVKLSSSGDVETFSFSDSTTVDSAEAGTSADVVQGATVLIKSGRDSDGKLEAREIIVLPKSTTFGTGG